MLRAPALRTATSRLAVHLFAPGSSIPYFLHSTCSLLSRWTAIRDSRIATSRVSSSPSPQRLAHPFEIDLAFLTFDFRNPSSAIAGRLLRLRIEPKLRSARKEKRILPRALQQCNLASTYDDSRVPITVRKAVCGTL